jgi:hypothetical protein
MPFVSQIMEGQNGSVEKGHFVNDEEEIHKFIYYKLIFFLSHQWSKSLWMHTNPLKFNLSDKFPQREMLEEFFGQDFESEFGHAGGSSKLVSVVRF